VRKISILRKSCDFFPSEMQAEEPELDVIEREAPPSSYHAFLNSKAWRELKALVIKRAGGYVRSLPS
jgi:hypothetical protein